MTSEVDVRRRLATTLLVVLAPSLAAVARAEEAVAIVAALAGQAKVRLPGAPARDVRLFDWLPSGAVLETATASTLLLAFADGQRQELGASASATLGAGRLVGVSGPVRTLAAIPPLPAPASLSPEARPGLRSAAVRVRGHRIAGLYPRGAATVLADEAVLRFSPVPGAASYRVEVEDEMAAVVFHAEVGSPSVRVSPGVLKPGARYFWVVRTLGTSGSPARGEAEFVTLAERAVAARAALREALRAPAGDASALALLGEIDRGLGLLAESRDAFREAIAMSPQDEALREALGRVEGALAEPPPEP
jgi:hypothetical protein